jgi:hypothetical protein
MEIRIREIINEILLNNLELIKIAIRQRAKFEGWLKFELAYYLEHKGFTNVRVELMGENKERSDVSFDYKDQIYLVELKTPNTNFRQKGVENKHRPITKNIKSIIIDANKLKNKNGIIAFVLFPIPEKNTKWENYIERISFETGIDISCENNCNRVTIPLENGENTTAVVCTFLSE